MLIQGDSAAIPLPDKSVHCVTTSPPYWGLRKYSGEQGRVWDGDPDCEHKWVSSERWLHRGSVAKSARVGATLNPKAQMTNEKTTDNFCQLCGAWYGGLGLEPTPQLHIQHIVEIMAEVHRVLRDDGCCWLNYGDCYSAAGWESNRRSVVGQGSFDPADRKSGKSPGFPAGNLMLMPHRVAIALQDWGWIVRNDVVWFKRNPMPEAVSGWRWTRHRLKDENDEWFDCPGCEKCLHTNPNWPQLFILKEGSFRHTRAHEYIFMLTKKMGYWANQEAVREGNQVYTRKAGGYTGHERVDGSKPYEGKGGFKDSDVTTVGRNPRSVMDVPTAPYKGSHYATFPPNLIAPLIRATCPRWACPICGQGWSPVVEKEAPPIDVRTKTNLPLDEIVSAGFRKGGVRYGSGQKLQDWLDANPPIIKEYRPTCEHEHTKDEAVPGIVFDPFVGSGTTPMVAKQLLRRGIGLDISMEYLDEQAKIRTGAGSPSGVLDDLPLFALMDDEV